MPNEKEKSEVRIVAEATAKPGRADALRAALLAMIPPSVAEPGCVSYELHEDRAEPGHFIFVERWADAAAFQFHTTTPHFRELGPAIADLIAAPPKLTQLQVLG